MRISLFPLVGLTVIAMASTAVAQNGAVAPRPTIAADSVRTVRNSAIPHDVAIPHPAQIELQLKQLTEQLAVAGLMEEARVAAALEGRIHEVHFQRLLAAHQSQPGNSKKVQINLQVQMAELRVSPESADAIRVLTGNPQMGQDPQHGQCLSAVLDQQKIRDWVQSAEQQGLIRMGSQVQATISRGRSTRLRFGHTQTVQVSDATDEASNAAFVGVTLKASADVDQSNLIRLRLVAEDATVGATGRVETEMEIRDGQTIVLGGLRSTATQTEVSRVPVLGDIPVVGRVFSSKKSTMVQSDRVFIVTPKVVVTPDSEIVPARATAHGRPTVQPASHSPR